jgi:hypothetical protein
MENRWSIRKPVALDVELHYQGKPCERCKTRDIGLGGMFIEVAESVIPRYGKVELDVHVDSGAGKKKWHRFVATVVHSSLQGLGVMFQDFTIADFRVLQEVLRLSPSGELIH